MNTLRALTIGAATLGAAAFIYHKMSEQKSFGPARFIDTAAAKGFSEIEAARLALEKTNSVEVKSFAYKMIEDHLEINKELRQLAREKGHELDEETDLINKARSMLLSLREADSFDMAYADHQVAAHEQIVAIFQQGTHLDDFEVSNFAQTMLSKLEHHLKMARALTRNLREAPAHPIDKPGVSASSATNEAVNKPAPQTSSMPLMDKEAPEVSTGTPQQNRGNAANPKH
ncbi:DUF4142 domain-containing protein [Pseudomonas sp. gcc21]|uniref:DUF4142 domain-containing protein n=1 Tax=Pseudomonas sp. gcc21 TaxID=2726989 RepID=UPI0014512779|nr:DUF4142 domain-containing protein [Pseudomonas sp. gcc21]QJD60510.1 DUF4142 domain-containing protein [Pseudomonas sp. gcc21]